MVHDEQPGSITLAERVSGVSTITGEGVITIDVEGGIIIVHDVAPASDVVPDGHGNGLIVPRFGQKVPAGQSVADWEPDVLTYDPSGDIRHEV